MVSRTKSFLNDMVLDLTDADRGKLAYISDSDAGNIVVYDFANDRSWKANHLTMRADIAVKKTLSNAHYSFVWLLFLVY